MRFDRPNLASRSPNPDPPSPLSAVRRGVSTDARIRRGAALSVRYSPNRIRQFRSAELGHGVGFDVCPSVDSGRVKCVPHSRPLFPRQGISIRGGASAAAAAPSRRQEKIGEVRAIRTVGPEPHNPHNRQATENTGDHTAFPFRPASAGRAARSREGGEHECTSDSPIGPGR